MYSVSFTYAKLTISVVFHDVLTENLIAGNQEVNIIVLKESKGDPESKGDTEKHRGKYYYI